MSNRSKYPYFDKVGRPTAVERDLCIKINKLVGSGEYKGDDIKKYVKKYGKVTNEIDLKKMDTFLNGEVGLDEVQGLKFKKTTKDGGLDLDLDEPKEESDGLDHLAEDNAPESHDDIGGGQSGESANPDNVKGMGKDAIDFNPFDDPVIERSYTKGDFGANEDDHQAEGTDIHDEQTGNTHNQNDHQGQQTHQEAGNTHESHTDSGNDYIQDAQFEEVSEDIPEPDWQTVDDEDDWDNQGEGGEEDDFEKEKMGGDNLQDLSPAQKRKAAEKTADALLQAYCKFAPLPFKGWASISDAKVQKLIMRDEIDPNMEIEEGVTVQEYIDTVNDQVEEIFTVQDETKEEIRDPLIEVLLEQEMALTPTQRLLMAVGGHVVTMGISAFSLSKQNKENLEAFREFREEQKQQEAPKPKRTRSASKPKGKKASYDEAVFETKNHERKTAKQVYDELNKDTGDVIDPMHDDSVEVEETHDD